MDVDDTVDQAVLIFRKKPSQYLRNWCAAIDGVERRKDIKMVVSHANEIHGVQNAHDWKE